MFGLAPIYDALTSCTSLSDTPRYKTEIFRTIKNRGKSCQVCKKEQSDLDLHSLPFH